MKPPLTQNFMALEDEFTIAEEPKGDGDSRQVLKFNGREVDIAECLGSDPCLDGREAPTDIGVQDMIGAVHARVATGKKSE